MPAVPCVSVVMPVYNGVGHLTAAIQSICTQTLPDWELIVVDDGSTDDTASLLRKIASLDDRIRPIRIRHQGVVGALGEGFKHVQAPYIARMDADDLAHPERLQDQAQLLGNDPELGLVSCLVAYSTTGTHGAGYARYVDWLNSLVTHEEIALNRFIESPLAHPSAMFRTALLERFGSYKAGPFPEDYELWLRWLDAGVRVAKVKRALLTWNDGPDRLSRTDQRYSVDAFYRCKAPYLARWLKQQSRGRRLLVWGAGRPTRKRAECLSHHGMHIDGYIDIDPDKIGRSIHGRLVISPKQIPSPQACFVIGYVAKHGARALARSHLQTRGFIEGADFIMAA